MPEARWIITTLFTDMLEPIQMTVHSCEEKDVKVVCRLEMGPFDDPTSKLDEIIQCLDQAVWSGKPVQLPMATGQ